MKDLEDHILVQRALKVDPDSFGELCRRYYPSLLAVAESIMLDHHLAEDAAQEALAAACRQLPKLKKPERFGPWIAAICRNVAKDMLSETQRQRKTAEARQERQSDCENDERMTNLDEAFEFHDEEPFESIKELLPKTVFNIQTFEGKVWIGIKEQLPVRIEGDLLIGKSFMTMFQELNLHEVNTFGDYNIELDEDIFDIAPPEGYTELTLSDILQVIPAEAKAGAAALGIIPAGLIFWKRQRRKATNPQ